jgi:hypothetical protein
MHDLVARSLSGHATVETHQQYSSVSALVRDGLAKVVSVMDFRREPEQRSGQDPTESRDAGGDAAEVALDGG